MKIEDVKITYEQFTDVDFTYPSNFYILNALGEYHFIYTKSRKDAQNFIDSEYGEGRYSIICLHPQKTKSRMESGGCSVVATATRARPSSRAPK